MTSVNLTASPLLKLMIRNAYTLEGLTTAENREAKNLIESESEKDILYRIGCGSRSIADTGLCREHNLYALATRK